MVSNRYETPSPSRLVPAILIFIISLAVLIPPAHKLPQHGDEAMYLWKAQYYTNRILAWDFSWGDPDSYVDPGFTPLSFWAMEQPFGSHLVYSLVMKLGKKPGPSAPYRHLDPECEKPEYQVPAATLSAVRMTAALCASMGLALVVIHWGWKAFFACLVFLCISSVRSDLSRAWAEGPLLLGLGLCAALERTKYWGVALGMAASFKLTAILLWPLAVYLTRKRTRRCRVSGVLQCCLAWTATNPISWFAGGPLYIVVLLMFRMASLFWQSNKLQTDIVGGIFWPSRYIWPFELAALLFAFASVPPIYRKAIRTLRKSPK